MLSQKLRCATERQQLTRTGSMCHYSFYHCCCQERLATDGGLLEPWRKTFMPINLLQPKKYMLGYNHDSLGNHKHFFHEFIDYLVSQWDKCINSYDNCFCNNKQFILSASFSFDCPLYNTIHYTNLIFKI